MKKIINRISIEKLILVSIMLLIIGVPFAVLLRYTGLLTMGESFDKVERAYVLWYGVPVLFILYILDLFLNKKKIGFADILVFLLILLGAISTIFAVNMSISIYGEYSRNEGLLSLLCYYLILLNLKNLTNEKYRKIIVRTIICLGVFQVIYGLLQVYTNWSFIFHYPASYIAFGLCGNPNFLGSYMVILSSFTFSMYLLERKKKYLILSVMFFMGICLCSSTGPFLTFLLIIIFFVIFHHKRIKWIDFMKIILLLGITYFFVGFSVKIVQTKIFHNEVRADYHISSVSSDLSLSDFGNGRLKLWKNSLPFIKEYWAVGAGLDNFGKIYGIRDGKYYDKAHNVYLQIAITNGMFALIIYMALMAIIFFKGFKIKEEIYISLFMAFIGYSIQSFANISVVEVAPTFFAICGLLLGKIRQIEVNKTL